MPGDPWAVVKQEPAAPAAAPDPWKVVAQQPVANDPWKVVSHQPAKPKPAAPAGGGLNPNAPVVYKEQGQPTETFANPAEAAAARARHDAPDHEAPGGLEGLVRRGVGAPAKDDTTMRVGGVALGENPVANFNRDATARRTADLDNIKKQFALSQDLGRVTADAQRRGGSGAARAAQKAWYKAHPEFDGSGLGVVGSALDIPFSSIEGLGDALVGRPVNKASGGRVPKTLPSDLAMLAAPGLGEKGVVTEAEQAVRRSLKQGGADARDVRVHLENQRALSGKPVTDKIGSVSSPAKKALRKGDELDPVKLKEPTPREQPDPTTQAQPLRREERIDTSLSRLNTAAKADKVDGLTTLQKIRKDLNVTPELAERASAQIERRMVDPKAKLDPDVEAYVKSFDRFNKEREADLKWLKSKGVDPDSVNLPVDIGAHVPRRVVGEHPGFDDYEAQSGEDAFGNRRAGVGKLSKNIGEAKARQFYVAQDANGNRHWMGKVPDVEEGFKMPDGRTARLATMEEVEANTDVRYHKDYGANVVDAWARTRQARRNAEFLQTRVKQLEGSGMAFKARSKIPLEGGAYKPVKHGDPPAGWQKTTLTPLEGYYFPPHIAQALDDFHGEIGSKDEAGKMFAGINRILTQAEFAIRPFVHAGNVGAQTFVGRGWDNANLARSARVGSRALRDVWGLRPGYIEAWRDGDALMWADRLTHDFHPQLTERAEQAFRADPRTWAPVIKQFGFKSFPEAIKAMAQGSHDLTWKLADTMVLARKYELIEQGLSRQEASAQLAREIPTYRVPATIGPEGWKRGRAMSQVLRDPRMGMFGRWHYGLVKGVGHMFQDLYAGHPEDKAKAAGQFLALAVGYAYLRGAGDKFAQTVTGHPNARMSGAGIFAIMQAADEVAQGEAPQSALTGRLATQSAAVGAAQKVLTGRDNFGRPLVPGGSPAETAAQIGSATADTLPVASDLNALARPGYRDTALWRELGIEVPSDAAERARGKQEQYRRRDQKAWRKKNPGWEALVQ